jgi:hypothetical protein
MFSLKIPVIGNRTVTSSIQRNPPKEDRRSKLQFRRYPQQEPDIVGCHGPSMMRDPAWNWLRAVT